MSGARWYAPIRPRRARRVALTVAVGQAAVMLWLMIMLPRYAEITLTDQVGFAATAVLVGAVLWRFASVQVHLAPEGLRVRNVIFSHQLEWSQIVSVRFDAGGGPWASLDLDDGTALAVLAIQRADGEHAAIEAKRLATLVAAHSRTERND